MGNTSTNEAAHQHPPHHGHLVTITVDGSPQPIHAGEYRVSQLKTLIRVPAEYELDLVVHGEFRPLDDNAEIKIHGHEVFVSHVRRGGSS